MIRRARVTVKLLGILLLVSLTAGTSPPVTLAGQNEWTASGGPPGPVYAVALDPSVPDTMYAATGAAGVFKSTDGGKQWTRASQGLGSNAVLSIAIDPSGTSTILAGTNRGIFRTDDAAATWTDSSPGIARDFFGFAFIYTIVPSSGSAGTFYAGTLQGVFRSLDAGRTWEAKNSGLQLGFQPAVEALAVDPAETGVLYASASYAGLGSTIFKSRDRGDTWVPLTTGLGSGQVSSLAVDPADHTIIYAATRGQGLLVSRDGGRTWQASGTATLETDLAAVVVSANPREVYLAGMRRAFYRSSDSGETWVEANSAIAKRGARSVALDNRNGGSLWLAASGGLYRGANHGSDWSESGRGITASEIVHVVTHALDSRLVFAGSRSDGVYRTLDGGMSWTAVPLGVGIVASLAVDPANPLLLYAGMIYISGIMDTGLYISRDGGNSWEPVPGFKGSVISAIAASPGKVYLATETGIQVSTDSGTTWSQSGQGLPASRVAFAVSVHPRDDSLLFSMIEAMPQTLFRSQDAGKTWSEASTFVRSVGNVVPSPAAPGLVFATTEDSVLVSSDAGSTWREIPFTGRGSIVTLRPHPVAPNTIYVGSTQGVYRSVDGGVSWTLLGLHGVLMSDIGISAADPTVIYGGTFGSGMWSYFAPPSLSASPAGFTFLLAPETPVPSASSVVVSDSSGGTFGWTLEAPPWLSINPTSSMTLPVTLTVRLNTAGLPAGYYEDKVTVSSIVTTTQFSPLSLPATLHLGPIRPTYLPEIMQGLAAW